MNTCSVLDMPLVQWAIREGFEKHAPKFFRLARASHLSSYHRAWHCQVLYTQSRAFLRNVLGDIVMAKENGKAKGKDNDFAGWANISLTDEDKDAIADMASQISEVEVLSWLGSMTFRGYRFSFSWDKYSDAQQVAIYCWADDDPNYGYALSSRHPDLDMALYSLMYKHQLKSKGVWLEFSEPRVSSWS